MITTTAMVQSLHVAVVLELLQVTIAFQVALMLPSAPRAFSSKTLFFQHSNGGVFPSYEIAPSGFHDMSTETLAQIPSVLSLTGLPSFDIGVCTGVWATVGTLMVVANHNYFRDLPQNKWIPQAAWTRAFIYFSFCNIFASVSGTTDVLLRQPLFTMEQLMDPWWQFSLVGCTLYILLAYWWLWSRMTLTFDRELYLGAALTFGLIWGVSTGQLLLSYYHLCSISGLTGWGKYMAAYSCMGLHQYIIQDYWWDVYISPEHDTPRSIIIKTAACHIPNVAMCLAFLCSFDNYAMFVGLQTLALTAAAIFQKFPAPWAPGKFDAPLTQTGVFGLPRGLGYTEEVIFEVPEVDT